MKWKIPPTIKIYEALGAVADGRVHIDRNSAKVFSSSGNKFYDVAYDPDARVIMMNDNGSYWQGYLGYPGIAFLMKKNIIKYDEGLAHALQGIAWKDINTKFKNDFTKTETYIKNIVFEKGLANDKLEKEINAISSQIEKLDLSLLGKRKKPPTGY